MRNGMQLRILLVAALLIGCDKAPPTSDEDNFTPRCDGIKQDGEDSVDSPFDLDGDGFFDQSNADCAATFQPNQLDCDDSNPEVNPSRLELPCNGVDDDCREASPENPDSDGDGVGACDDCDDQNPRRFPGNPEVCFDEIDNDCDSITDNACGEDYNGTWTLAEPIDYECGLAGLPPLLPPIPVVQLDMAEFFTLWAPPNMTLGQTVGSSPPPFEGTVELDGAVLLTVQEGVVGDCVRNWTLEGQFIGDDMFEGTIAVDFNGIPLLCGNCPAANGRSWPVSATKQP